jgi:3-deoxy-manno-octulosonate cytidylyltransferase (CMP-KDO synthetase)
LGDATLVARFGVIAVIPARYGSSRLHAKALADIGGMPMVVRVWRRAMAAHSLERVLVATDDERIARVVRDAGGEAIMTAETHLSGTDRIAEVAERVVSDVYINVQGDLPFLAAEDLDQLAGVMRSEPALEMATIATSISGPEEWQNPNVVKVVCDERQDALYFSRSAIPFARDGDIPSQARRHIGVYAYRRDFLMKFTVLGPGSLEMVERLEQLRALEHGHKIRVLPSVAPSLEVDTADDLARARAFLTQ